MIGSSFSPQRLICVDSGRQFGLVEQDSFTQQILQDRIGRQLREMYSELMEEPLPDRLTSLLAELERAPQGEQE
jgi:hypothetical protein